MSDKIKKSSKEDGLYLFGSGEMDQLSPLREGKEDDEICESKIPLKIPLNFIIPSEKITQIQCGQMFTMILSNLGNVYTFGCADNGGLGHEESNEAKRVDLSFKATGVSGGDCHGIAYNRENLAFWGQFRNTQGPIGEAILSPKYYQINNFSLQFIKKAISGTNHVIILTVEKNVFSFGNKEFGQLGLIPDEKEYNHLTIYKIDETDVEDIFTGDEHSFLIKKEGRRKYLKGWGLNNKGQVGIGTYATEENPNVNVFKPTKINIPGNLNVKKCVGGNGISGCITENNIVFCWGFNEDNLLGMDCDEMIIPSPKEFIFFNRDDNKIDDIYSTYLYYYGINREKNKVYSWGMGESYVLGNKKEKQEQKPYLIKSDFFKNLNVIDIALGCSHVAVILKKERGYTENIEDYKKDKIIVTELNFFGVQKRKNDRLPDENEIRRDENLGILKEASIKEEFIKVSPLDMPKTKKIRHTY